MSLTVRDRKCALRAQFKKYRMQYPPNLKQEVDRVLYEKFISLKEFRDCDTLLAYISQNIECDTAPIIKKALIEGKRVAVPKCAPCSNEMDFYFIQSDDDLARGQYGIFEPIPARCEKVVDFSDGLCLVPGLSFDWQGYRLGFGKGYYDRFLDRFGGVTVGICYAKCMANALPRDVYDKAVAIVMTENDTKYQ